MPIKKEWLQVSQRQRLSPFPNYLSMESITREMKRVIGYAYKEVITFFQNNNTHIFIDKTDHRRVGQAILKIVIAKPDIFLRYTKIIENYAKAFYKFIKQHYNPNYLKRISNNKLASLFYEFEKRYRQIYAIYFPVLAVENYLFEYLRDYIFKKVKEEKKAGHYLNVLITEFSAMVNRQERKAALKLAIRIKQNKKWLGYFKSTDWKKIKKDKVLSRLIKNQEKNFFWLTRDYDDQALTFNDFVKRLKDDLEQNPLKQLNKLVNEEKRIKKEQQQIIKQLAIEKKFARFFQTIKEGMFYKEYRKTIVSSILHYFDPILLETAKRCHLTLNQVRHLKISEVLNALNGRDYSQELSQRIKLSVWWAKQGRSKIWIGNQAEKIYYSIVKIDKNTKILTGMPVSPGVAKGPVKIVINPDAFHKVKEGDIIITLQATPIFSTVISLSSGMVCDGGPGITSHPATLAREAGIPCIIGAKYATKILKDGDIIEVDGTKGVMKIIKKNK